MYSALSKNKCSSAMQPFFHFAIVAMGIFTLLPLAGIDFPSASFIGSEKVASITPVAAVHSPDPKAIG